VRSLRRHSQRDTRRLRKLRTVTFSSIRGRIIWGAVGLLALGIGYWLIFPTFSGTSEPPNPWGLWIGINAATPQNTASSSLELDIEPLHGCDRPSTVTGTMSWHRGDEPLSHIPTRLAFAVAGVRLLKAEAEDPETEVWRPIPVIYAPKISVGEAVVPHWREELSVGLRLTLVSSHSAGYEACDVTSPALFEYQGGEEYFAPAHIYGEGYLEDHSGRGFNGTLLTEAVINMAVPHEMPDRTVLDAGAQVRRSFVLHLACNAPDPARERYPSQESQQSSCASVQTFRAPDASDSLDRRVFFSGILISMAIGILLEAVLTGKLAKDDNSTKT
jgi:hypothetical protein